MTMKTIMHLGRKSASINGLLRAHYPRLTDSKEGQRSSFEEVRSIACSATRTNASFASSPPEDLARSGWQTPMRAFNVPFTIANATKAGHAAKTSEH
jgi:hypothetical protein